MNKVALVLGALLLLSPLVHAQTAGIPSAGKAVTTRPFQTGAGSPPGMAGAPTNTPATGPLTNGPSSTNVGVMSPTNRTPQGLTGPENTPGIKKIPQNKSM